MNIYRGCTHNCAYCDGRAEGYYVSGEFGSDIEVKINAVELLEKELNPGRKSHHTDTLHGLFQDLKSL
jgi:DNA repair photolyase